uniref:C3H1-type domain-containing protein n=1 Tax=Strongyloides papillosus TaxID=174720 RepID=A0A0N5BFQ4_STREA
MEARVGEFLHHASGYPENYVNYDGRPLYSEGNQQQVDYGGCCSSMRTVTDGLSRVMINQEQSRPPVSRQPYYERMVPGNSFTHNRLVNFAYSYNPQSFAESMNSYHYERPYSAYRDSSSNYLNSSSGSYKLRNIRRRRPIGHFQESTFHNSFTGSGISSNDYLDRRFTYSGTYLNSNDGELYSIKRKRSVEASGDSYSTSDFTSSVCSNVRSNSSSLPLFRDERTLTLGVCPSFLLTNKCALFPNCLLSHSRKDFEDYSNMASEGHFQQNQVVPMEECKHFSVGGKCPVGFHCNFIHRIPAAEHQNEQTTIVSTKDASPVPDEDIFREFFVDNINDEINQCFDIDKAYINDYDRS